MVTPKVSIIILNWNGWKDTIECLDSLYRIDYPNYDVIVVDNGSTDESIKMIKKYCFGEIEVDSKFFKYNADNKPIRVFETLEDLKHTPSDFQLYETCEVNRRLILIKNKENYGFAKGNNIGIKFALKFFKPDYILLLNNDTVVDKDFLSELIEFSERTKADIVGPKIYYYDFNGKKNVISFIGEKIVPWKAAGKRYGANEEDRGQYDNPMEVDRVEGSCMLVRAKVFEKVGFLDEDYFLFYEETDFCIRAKKAGFKIMYCPTAKIWHKVGGSTGKISPIRFYNFARSRVLFIKKNFKLYLPLYLIYEIYYTGKFLAGLFYRKRPKKLILYHLRGLIDGLLGR